MVCGLVIADLRSRGYISLCHYLNGIKAKREREGTPA